MQFRTFYAQDTQGNVIPGATVAVRQPNTTTEVTVFDENDGALSGIVTDAVGRFAFAAPNGAYDIFIEKGALTATLENENFSDTSLFDGIWFASATTILADTELTYTTGRNGSVVAGDLINTNDGLTYEVAASGASNEHVTTAGGVKLYVRKVLGKYPLRAFGAAGDGTTNDSAAIQLAFNAASADVVGNDFGSLANNGTIQITGEGLPYRIGSEVEIPTLTGVKIVDAYFWATDAFSDSYMFATPASGTPGYSGVINTFFENCHFDANRRGGCVYIDDYIHAGLRKCYVRHFSTYGFRSGPQGVEAMVFESRLEEYTTTETDINNRGAHIGTAVYFGSTDSELVDCVLGVSLLHVGAASNVSPRISGCHFFYHASVTELFTSFDLTGSVTITDSFFDQCGIGIKDPSSCIITGNRWLVLAGTTAGNPVMLEPQSANYTLSNFICHTNRVINNTGSSLAFCVESGPGSFNAANLIDVAIYDNIGPNLIRTSTRAKASQAFSSTGLSGTIDVSFGSMICFGDIQQISDSLYRNFLPGSAPYMPQRQITSINNSTYTLSFNLEFNVSGTIYAEIDTSKYRT